jgi:hypothetical protein
VKKIIMALVCAFVTPLAFAQTSTTTTEQTTTTEPTTTTETTTTTTTNAYGTVTTYEPGKTIIIREKDANNPVSYVLGKTARVINKAGEIVTTPIRAGARVRVYYTPTGETRVVDRVIVED